MDKMTASRDEVNHEKEKHERLPTPDLNDIITQNLSSAIYDERLDISIDLNDELESKSNASSVRRRSSMSYSQPNTPRARSLSPVSDVSSISELSTEYQSCSESNSESCASLNSMNSSAMSADFAFLQFRQRSSICEDRIEILDDTSKSLLVESKPSTKRKNKKKKENTLDKASSYDLSKPGHRRAKSRQISRSKPVTRRNSKDCLDISTLARLSTKSIELWSNAEVLEWIKVIHSGKYREYAVHFKRKKIDGRKLYKMNRQLLQSMEIYHPAARKGILAALQKLKSRVRQNEKKKINLYASSHKYGVKKHRRGVSTPNGLNKSLDSLGLSGYSTPGGKRKKKKIANSDYFVAVKRQNAVTEQSMVIPTTVPALSPLMTAASTPVGRKESQDISEFLQQWEIKQSDSSINFLNSTILEQTDHFTMIQLDNKRIVYAVTARVEQWTTQDVCKWLNSIASGRFKKFIPKFRVRNTNGFDLLNISRVQLQNTIGMMDPQMRSCLLKEVKLLKIATQPPRDRHGHSKLKKRKSAMSSKEVEAAKSSKMKSTPSTPGHRKSASVHLNSKSTSLPPANTLSGIVPRKLGPRDIGRNSKFKGTKWDRHLFNYEFLEEKIDHKASTKAFNQRKRKNPIKHKETVGEIGTAVDFEKPEYTDDVIEQYMKSGDWLKEKPLSRRNIELEKLKDHHVTKSAMVCELSQSPNGWRPIEFEMKEDGKHFLAEHFWFDGSAVQFDFNLISRLLKCLPPRQIQKFHKVAAPTGYESKLNWLRMLLEMVNEEKAKIEREDAIFASMDFEDGVVNIDDMDETKENAEDMINTVNTVNLHDIGSTDNRASVELDSTAPTLPTIDIIQEDEEESPRDVKEEEVPPPDLGEIMERMNPSKSSGNGSSTASGSSDDGDSDGSHCSVTSTHSLSDMMTKRKQYKAARMRARTLVPGSPLTRKRRLSRQDMQRRRFFSQESINGLQTLIKNMEKSKASGK